MGIESRGLKELIGKFQKLPKAISDEQRLAMKRNGRKVVRDARNNHNYNNPPHMITSTRQYSPSGNLDRAIQSEVKASRRGLLDAGYDLRVFINPVFVTVNGYNYGVIQHDGMGGGYKPSPISPRFGTTGRNYLENDWFVYNAWKANLKHFQQEMKRVPKRARKKVGL